MPASVLADAKPRVVTHFFMMPIVKIETCLLAPISPESTNERTIIPIDGSNQTLTYCPALLGFDKEADFPSILPGQPCEAPDFKISYPLPKGPLVPPALQPKVLRKISARTRPTNLPVGSTGFRRRQGTSQVLC